MKRKWLHDSTQSLSGAAYRFVEEQIVTLRLKPGDTINALRGIVEFVEPVGSTTFVFVRLEKPEGAIQDDDRIVAGVNARYPIAAGDKVGLNFRIDRMRLFDPTGPALRDDEWSIREHQVSNWRRSED